MYVGRMNGWVETGRRLRKREMSKGKSGEGSAGKNVLEIKRKTEGRRVEDKEGRRYREKEVRGVIVP